MKLIGAALLGWFVLWGMGMAAGRGEWVFVAVGFIAWYGLIELGALSLRRWRS